jgi:hypothetical protein
MSSGRRFRLFLNVLAIVVLLVALKFAVHLFHAEYLTLDTLFSSVVAGTIFIIGFLLSGLLPDYKEAERVPGDIRVALEAIYDDVVSFSRQTEGVRVYEMREIVLSIVASLEKGLGDRADHAHLGAAIAETDRLVPFILDLERLGMSQNFIVRMRGALDTLRKCVYRTYYIQKIEFLPSVHVLIQTLALAVIALLMLLKTDGSIGSAMIFGFASFLFVFALHLISVFEQPFRPGSHSADKVSLFLLHEFVAKLRDEVDTEAPQDCGALMPMPRRDARVA